MVNINSINDLEKELNKYLLKSMKSLGKEASKDLKESVQRNVYDTYIPKYYKRTKDLKNSVTNDIKQNRNGTTATIYHDIGRFKQNPPTQKYRIGTHHSTVKNYKPQKYAYFIPITIDEGTSGHIFGTGAWTQPRRYFGAFSDKWTDEFENKLRRDLINRGLVIRRV